MIPTQICFPNSLVWHTRLFKNQMKSDFSAFLLFLLLHSLFTVPKQALFFKLLFLLMAPPLLFSACAGIFGIL